MQPLLETATILWVSWLQIICDEYWPRQNSWTTSLRPFGLMFPKDGRMVLVLPAWRGFQQKVRKHRVHWPTLASGRESKQAPSGARETLHPAGKYIFVWVWIPLNSSGASETLHSADKCMFEWFLNPGEIECYIGFESLLIFLECLKLFIQLANGFSNRQLESRWCYQVERVKLFTDPAGNCINLCRSECSDQHGSSSFYMKRIYLFLFINFNKWLSFVMT